jgi:tetratricopeptide (TPR) repeat protein
MLLTLYLLFGGQAPGYAANSARDFNRGLEAGRDGDLDRAIYYWSRTILQDEDCYAAYVNRGTAYFLTGQVMNGVVDWHEATKYAPIFAYGVFAPRFIEQATGKRNVLNFARPLEIDPDLTASILMMGAGYVDLGRKRSAARLFRMSIELTKNPVLKNQLEHWATSLEEEAGF